MKRSPIKCCSQYWLYIFPVLAVLLYSCDTYNFSHPQPVDKENIYTFPDAYRGNWIDDDSEQLLINKDFIGFIMNEKIRVVKGIWPKAGDKGNYTYPPPSFKSFSTVMFDTLQQPVDTIRNYLLNGKHIYEFADKELLEQGYHYSTDQDTIMIDKKDTFIVDLGRNAFLRDIGNGFFVMNIRNQVVGKEDRWWQLFVLEMKHQDQINIWYCSNRLTTEPAMFYEKQNNYYFNSEWTAAEITKLLKNGSFEMCNQLHRNLK